MSELRPRQFDHLYLATDHAGFALKEVVRTWLLGEDFAVTDVGAHQFDPDDDFVDYIQKAAQAVGVAESSERIAAIIFGGSGQGEAMAANRIPGVRAAVYYGLTSEIVPLSRVHNNANVLSLGARFVADDEAKAVVWEWLHTPTSTDEKYHRRNAKLDHF